jgi:AraC-like DNA-binding protein
MDFSIDKNSLLRHAAERVLQNICNGRIVFLSAPQPVENTSIELGFTKKGYTLDNHHHPEIAQVVEGRARLNLAKGFIDLVPRQCVFIAPQTLHGETYYQRNLPYTLLWMVAHPSGINFFLSAYNGSKFYIPGERYLMDTPTPNPLWNSTYEDLKTSILKWARVQEYLLHACCQMAENTDDRIHDTTAYHQKLAEQIRNYIDLHYAQSLKIEDLARISRCSPNHLNTLFRKYIGIPIHQYILRQRLQEAKRLLEHSKTTAKEVAYRLGFNDPLYFSRVFRKHFSVPPSQVIRAGRQKEQ